MISKKLSFVSIAALGAAGLASVASPANAVPVQVSGCGPQSTDNVTFLERVGGYCQLEVDVAGAYSWTVPANVSSIQAVLVGGGGGASVWQTQGYAAQGGEVTYVNTTVVAGDTISGEVGAPGKAGGLAVASATPTAGGSTSLGINSNLPWTASGGNFTPYTICSVGTFFLGAGSSYAGTAPSSCIDSTPNGVAVGTDVNAPVLFNDVAGTLGNGGFVAQNNSYPTTHYGDGGSVDLSTDSLTMSLHTFMGSNPGDGMHGWVSIRYAAATAPFSYNANGATGGNAPTDATTHYTYEDVTVLGNTGSLTRTGYTFNGWNTAADGTGTAYAAASTVNLGAAGVTLYAQWTAAPVAQNPITKKITTFKGDSSKLIPGMRTQINKFLRSVPNGGAISCIGSTSGAKVTGFDKKLAKNRALTVCAYAKKVRSDITYTLHINPSSGKGVNARHVWMSYTPSVS